MVAYVTFRMTLAGHTGVLPHQFYCCPGGNHNAHTYRGTCTLTPSPCQRGSTWPNTPAVSDWLPTASSTPPAHTQRDSAWKQSGRTANTTDRCCSAHKHNYVIHSLKDSKHTKSSQKTYRRGFIGLLRTKVKQLYSL